MRGPHHRQTTMTRCVVFVGLLAAASALVEESEWKTFMQKYNKSYGSASEELHRREVFSENLKYMERHMREYSEGKHSYTVGVNQFSDLSAAEWRTLRSGARLRPRALTTPDGYHQPSQDPAPSSRDWRDAGAVTPVGNEGQCGSCWAFSTTGTLEGMWKLAGHPLVKLSEQQLMDCSRSYGNYGCSGGLMDNSYKYILDVGGLTSAEQYPYRGDDKQKCSAANTTAVATLSSWVDVEPGSEADMQDAVGNIGPLANAWDASSYKFMMYTGGVFDDPDCGTNVDHSGILVGYGTTEDGQEYWLVKNVWGQDWGERGYVRMSRNKNNQCGIANEASYVVV